MKKLKREIDITLGTKYYNSNIRYLVFRSS